MKGLLIIIHRTNSEKWFVKIFFAKSEGGTGIR